MDHWILDENGEPQRTDLMTWARWFQDTDARQISRTWLPNGIEVSTVFLGIDHNFGSGPPILWESLAFDKEHGSMDGTMRRYETREEALAGHEALVKELS